MKLPSVTDPMGLVDYIIGGIVLLATVILAFLLLFATF
jgi:hypothetical protein